MDAYDSIKARYARAKANAKGDPFNWVGDPDASALAVENARARAEEENTEAAWALYRDALTEHEANHGPLQQQP